MNDWAILVLEDSKQEPRDDDRPSNITFSAVKCITDRGSAQPSQSDDDGNFCSESWKVVDFVNSEGAEQAKDDEDDGIGVPEGEREVDEEDVRPWF